MKRAAVRSILVAVVLLALRVTAEAQQPAKVPRIGFVSGTGDTQTPGSQVEAFRRGLRDLGYFEANNIQVEYRYVEGSWIVSQISLPNSSNSRSMSWSLEILQRSAQPSKQPRRFRLSW